MNDAAFRRRCPIEEASSGVSGSAAEIKRLLQLGKVGCSCVDVLRVNRKQSRRRSARCDEFFRALPPASGRCPIPAWHVALPGWPCLFGFALDALLLLASSAETNWITWPEPGVTTGWIGRRFPPGRASIGKFHVDLSVGVKSAFRAARWRGRTRRRIRSS